MNVLSVISKHEFYKLKKYKIYGGILHDYKKRPGNATIFEIIAIHRKGFLVSDWRIMRLTKENYRDYLSSKQYSKFHPINGYYTKLIDDKVTIKYILAGTELAKYTPDYYYLIDESGIICSMMDAPVKKEKYEAADVLSQLKTTGVLAVKLATGSIGRGFYKCSFQDGVIMVNGKEIDESGFVSFVSNLKNYIVMEYLRPHEELAAFWPTTANTIRYLLCRVNGEYAMLKSFIRFGSRKTGEVENFNSGGVLCYIDENGCFNGGYTIVSSRNKLSSTFVEKHPDTGVEIKGVIPQWAEVQKAAEKIARYLPETKYLGFDFVVTDKNEVKLLEINSLTSLDSIQMDGSILQTEVGKKFFSSLKAY